jgi:hypothetical protein
VRVSGAVIGLVAECSSLCIVKDVVPDEMKVGTTAHAGFAKLLRAGFNTLVLLP